MLAIHQGQWLECMSQRNPTNKTANQTKPNQINLNILLTIWTSHGKHTLLGADMNHEHSWEKLKWWLSRLNSHSQPIEALRVLVTYYAP